MKRGIFIVGFGVSISILLFSQVMAQGGRIRFNNLKVIPGITLQEVYDDNIYLGSGSNNTT